MRGSDRLRAWCAGFSLHAGVVVPDHDRVPFGRLAHGHSERMKRRLLERKASGQGILTDEEYEREMRQLAAEAVMEASDADLEAWLAARTVARQRKATPRGQA